MKIMCANWQNADEGELEHQHYPDIELVIARSTNDAAAKLDPEVAKTVDAVINYSPTHSVALPPTAFPMARIAVRSGVGFDNIDTAGWGARNIPACNVPDYGTTEVADHALALMLALTRGTTSYPNAIVAEGQAGWHFTKAPLIRRHKNATFVIVGLGRIGLAADPRAAAFDIKVVLYDPHLLSGVDLSTGYERVHSLNELMSRSDVVSIHAPLNAQTRGMMNADAFAASKPGLILVNTARGPIVDLSALESAMRTGKVLGAGLDVLLHEPGDVDHPLLAAWRKGEDWIKHRLIITPHAAFYSPASMVDLRLKSIEVVRAFLADGRLTNCVNAEYLTK